MKGIKLFLVIVFAMLAVRPLGVFGQELPVIEIGRTSTTHILFETDLSYVDISLPKCVSAKIVESSKNLLAIKAAQEFDFKTTVTALEVNGTLHNFTVVYSDFPSCLTYDTRSRAEISGGAVNTQMRPSAGVAAGGRNGANAADSLVVVSSDSGGDGSHAAGTANVGKGRSVLSRTGDADNRADAPTLAEIVEIPQRIFHVGDSRFKVDAFCTNVFVYADVLYLVVRINNRSAIGYDAGEAQFNVEPLKPNQQSIYTSRATWAQSSYGSLSAGPKGEAVVGYSIPKLTLNKNECLKVYIYERNGTRNLVLTLRDEDVNYAVSPFDVSSKK